MRLMNALTIKDQKNDQSPIPPARCEVVANVILEDIRARGSKK